MEAEEKKSKGFTNGLGVALDSVGEILLLHRLVSLQPELFSCYLILCGSPRLWRSGTQ